MKNAPNERAEAMRIAGPRGSNNGHFLGQCDGAQLGMIASDGAGWDHVSVSCKRRCPTWDEMCWVKRLWFDDRETVIQYHPSSENYVNHHPFCLHLWRPQTDAELGAVRDQWGEEWDWGNLVSAGILPLPPTWMIGPHGANSI